MQWIVTDDIYSETWRRLLEFSNIDLAVDRITQIHGTPPLKSQRDNYQKQAAQARVCVLQAKEYFDAARSSSFYTSANHSYYGAAALASLMMLILGDGTKSLDYLRSDNKNCHHGLDFTTGCNSKTATVAIELIEHSFVEILKYGHFANWYSILPIRGSAHGIVHKSHGPISFHTMDEIGGYNIPSFHTISGKKKSLLNLLKYFPDLDTELQRFGINTPHSRSSSEVTHSEDGSTIYRWRIHGCRSMNELDMLLERFLIKSNYSNCLTFQGADNSPSGIVTLQFSRSMDIDFKWPDSRDTMNHDTISYADTIEMHEIVDLYLVSYQLSMLSRYFPDIWIRCMESQCRAAKLIERAIEIILKKFPILSLSILTGENTVISTHLQPWRT